MLKYSLQHIWKSHFKFMLGEHWQQGRSERWYPFSALRAPGPADAANCAEGEET